jgi:hypothetical protein
MSMEMIAAGLERNRLARLDLVLGHAELLEPVRNLLHCGVPQLQPD